MSISSSLTIEEAPGIMVSAAGAFSSPVAVAAGASARGVGLSAPGRGDAAAPRLILAISETTSCSGAESRRAHSLTYI